MGYDAVRTATIAATVNNRLPHVHVDGYRVPVIVVDTVGMAGMVPVYLVACQDDNAPAGVDTMECRADELCFTYAEEVAE